MGCPTPIGPRPRFIPAPLVAQVTMQYYLDDQPVENVFHVKNSTEWTLTTLGALGTIFENWETAVGKFLRGNSTQLHAVIAVALVTEDGLAVVSAVAIDGTRTSVQLPNNCSFAIKLNTGHRGRSFRGRTYWIGITEDQLASSTSNQIDGSHALQLRAAVETLMGDIEAGGFTPVVLSYANDCTWRTAGVATPITAVELTDFFVDSQRRRLPAHNIHH